ncbi:PHD finger protein ALFIN-LIKE 1 [Striga asiatica]|uniref:PHD finger protein ALFIN-LIKE 1 n=1 Tax=Striga asiatica TaxID=4170 RepID=A0A5A7P8M8_STRAF|nr:PHD finger protein ALFIN-LIKE 1 [Striga asiatica]
MGIDENAVVCMDGDGFKIRSGSLLIDVYSDIDTSIACDSCDMWYQVFCLRIDPKGRCVGSWLCPRVSVYVADDGETAVVVSLFDENQECVALVGRRSTFVFDWRKRRGFSTMDSTPHAGHRSASASRAKPSKQRENGQRCPERQSPYHYKLLRDLFTKPSPGSGRLGRTLWPNCPGAEASSRLGAEVPSCLSGEVSSCLSDPAYLARDSLVCRLASLPIITMTTASDRSEANPY